MSLTSKLLILQFMLLCTSCAMMDSRDYDMVMNERFDDEMWVPEKDFPIVPGDSGRAFRSDNEIINRVPAGEKMARDLSYNRSLHQELKILESKLNESEWEDYLKIRNQLGSTSQKIYFLKLSYNEKLAYLNARNINVKRSYTVQDVYKNDIYSQKPIGLGMSKDEVINRWGRPVNRQFAGSPSDQNERWSFQQNGRVKHVYFEHGHVEGWTEQ
jgi:hypothetical protein